MLKSFCGVLALLCFAASFAFAALLTSTPAPAPVTEPAPVAVIVAKPVLFETGSMLVFAKPKPAATVARAPKAKAYQCGTWEASNVGGAYKRCEWR